MEDPELNLLNKYKLNKYQFCTIRETSPIINLYEKSYFGTEDIRQYIYCKRIIFFRYVMHAPMMQSIKMEYGTRKHDKLQQIKNKEDEEYSQKYYNIYLNDAELGLMGLIDYFEFDGKEAYPVEIKTGHSPPDHIENAHKYQITAQAMLIEKNFDFLVKKARIYYTKDQKYEDYQITFEDKLKIIEIIRNLNQIIELEKIPEPTEDKGKCIDCECYRYCLRA